MHFYMEHQTHPFISVPETNVTGNIIQSVFMPEPYSVSCLNSMQRSNIELPDPARAVDLRPVQERSVPETSQQVFGSHHASAAGAANLLSGQKTAIEKVQRNLSETRIESLPKNAQSLTRKPTNNEISKAVKNLQPYFSSENRLALLNSLADNLGVCKTSFYNTALQNNNNGVSDTLHALFSRWQQIKWNGQQ